MMNLKCLLFLENTIRRQTQCKKEPKLFLREQNVIIAQIAGEEFLPFI